MGHPCFTPVLTLNHSCSTPSQATEHSLSTYISLMMPMILSSMPCDFIIFHRLFWCTESKAFSKSMKLRYNVDCHSTDCLIMFLSVNICSTVFLPSLKPACSFLSSLSNCSFILFIIIFQNIFDAIGSNVIPLQFPFLGILIPFLHLFGIVS